MYTLFKRLHFTNFVRPFYTLQLSYKTVRADYYFKSSQFLELWAVGLCASRSQFLIWKRLTYLSPRTPVRHRCILPLKPRPHRTPTNTKSLHQGKSILGGQTAKFQELWQPSWTLH